MSQESGSLLKITPLGGLGEIGLNMMVLEYEDTMMVVDSGLMFPEDYMLGVDIVIPDFEFIRANAEKIRAVILTHSHEDHIGALPFLIKEVDAPVYGTPFTLGMVTYKLRERDLLHRANLREIKPRDKIQVGPFEVEFASVCHSVVDGVGMAIRTPAGMVVHTGDFKISHGSPQFGVTDLSQFASFGDEGVLALMSDSTNAEKEGYTISENEVALALDDLFKRVTGRIIVAVFASNIPRIAQIIQIAEKRNRKIVINGRSIEFSVNLAQELGFFEIPKGMEIGVGEVEDYPDEEVLILTTGSQGEPMSALARMATGNHKQVKIKAGDTAVLSSKFIPGNEKAIANIINRLYRLGADVIYEKISAIHVSGHAFREELKLMIQLTRPRFLMPVHGEFRHLIHHGRLAQQMGIDPAHVLIVENGDQVCFDGKKTWVDKPVTTGRVLVDGKGVGDVGKMVLRERRALSEHGMVVVTLILDEDTGVIIHGPQLSSKGFVFETEKGHLLRDAECVVLEALEDVDLSHPGRVSTMRREIQRALRQYFSFVIRRRPVILPMIMEV